MSTWPLLIAVAAATQAAPPSSAPAGPPAGDYAARLCVTVGAQTPQCGPAEARVSSAGQVRLKVHDFTYYLVMQPPMLIGVMLHGPMQVGEFESTYRWAGRTLLYADPSRGLQYELDLAPATRP